MNLERAIPTLSVFTLAAACSGPQQVPSDGGGDTDEPIATDPDAGTDPIDAPEPDPVEPEPMVPDAAVGTPVEALIPLFSQICEAYAQCYPDDFIEAFDSQEACVTAYAESYVEVWRDGDVPLDDAACAEAFAGYLGCVAEYRCSGYLDYGCESDYVAVDYACYGYGPYEPYYDGYDEYGEGVE